MTRFILNRILVLIMGYLAASLIIFATLRILPGNVAQLIGGVQASPEEIAQLTGQLGLDKPWYQQYWEWISALAHQDLGNSLINGTATGSELVQKASVTLPLAALGLVLALLIGMPAGIFSAYHRVGKATKTITYLGMLSAAIPVIWVGLILTLVFSNWWGVFPAQGFPAEGWHRPFTCLHSLFLPALTIGIAEGAVLFRFVRSATLSALNAPYVRTAMSYGYTRAQALIRTVLPSVSLSIISVLGLQIAGLLVGAVVVEQVFALPGIGKMLVVDVGNRDLLKIQSTLLVITGAILLIGMVIDILHRIIDPRLRTEGQEG